MKKFLIILLSVIFCVSAAGCQSYAEDKTKNYDEISWSDVKKIDLSSASAYVFGSSNAALTIIEYTSYECIDCANLHKNIGKKLNQYINKGIVRLVFKPIVHSKFENDIEINKRFVPESYSDVETIFSKFEDYAKKDKNVILSALNLKDENPAFDKMNQNIKNELDQLSISHPPTIIINNRKYSEVIFTEQDFDKLIAELAGITNER